MQDVCLSGVEKVELRGECAVVGGSGIFVVVVGGSVSGIVVGAEKTGCECLNEGI